MSDEQATPEAYQGRDAAQKHAAGDEARPVFLAPFEEVVGPLLGYDLEGTELSIRIGPHLVRLPLDQPTVQRVTRMLKEIPLGARISVMRVPDTESPFLIRLDTQMARDRGPG